MWLEHVTVWGLGNYMFKFLCSARCLVVFADFGLKNMAVEAPG